MLLLYNLKYLTRRNIVDDDDDDEIKKGKGTL